MIGQFVGQVSYVHPELKYFFLRRDDGNGDVYLGLRELNEQRLPTPEKGDRFRFDLKSGSGGKLRAVNVSKEE